MRLPEVESEIDKIQFAGLKTEGQVSIDHSLKRRIERLCLEELERSCFHLTPDKYRQIEKMLLRIVSRIAEPLLVQLREADVNRSRQTQRLRMIQDAFELQEVNGGR